MYKTTRKQFKNASSVSLHFNNYSMNGMKPNQTKKYEVAS